VPAGQDKEPPAAAVPATETRTATPPADAGGAAAADPILGTDLGGGGADLPVLVDTPEPTPEEEHVEAEPAMSAYEPPPLSDSASDADDGASTLSSSPIMIELLPFHAGGFDYGALEHGGSSVSQEEQDMDPQEAEAQADASAVESGQNMDPEEAEAQLSQADASAVEPEQDDAREAQSSDVCASPYVHASCKHGAHAARALGRGWRCRCAQRLTRLALCAHVMYMWPVRQVRGCVDGALVEQPPSGEASVEAQAPEPAAAAPVSAHGHS
jgi:hypothetical protein